MSHVRLNISFFSKRPKHSIITGSNGNPFTTVIFVVFVSKNRISSLFFIVRFPGCATVGSRSAYDQRCLSDVSCCCCCFIFVNHHDWNLRKRFDVDGTEIDSRIDRIGKKQNWSIDLYSILNIFKIAEHRFNESLARATDLRGFFLFQFDHVQSLNCKNSVSVDAKCSECAAVRVASSLDAAANALAARRSSARFVGLYSILLVGFYYYYFFRQISKRRRSWTQRRTIRA